MRTDNVLVSLFDTKQFSYESINGNKKEKIQEIFKQAVTYLPITELDKGIYYRTRIINPADGEDTGIIRENNIPISGYNDQYSGVPSVEDIKENGRVNHIGEQVLYLSEDIETSCKEKRPSEIDYLSVAECDIKNSIKVMDFTIKSSDGLDDLFSDETIQLHLGDITAFYIFVKEYLTSPDYKVHDYKVPLDFLDIVKKRTDISGIKYDSAYTNKYNIALWDENKYSRCTNSKVMKAQITIHLVSSQRKCKT